MSLNYKDISFVVQGPIFLNKEGEVFGGFTYNCIKSIKKYFPGSTIILSTWKNSVITGLEYDFLVESDDPGTNKMGLYESNCFRQIVSTINGLRLVKTKYAFKIRVDNELKSDSVIDYYLKYSKCNFDDNYKILNNRVVTLTTCNPNRRTKWPYNVCDWIFFGLTEDLLNIFSVSLTEEKVIKKDSNDNEICLINPITPEQYIWVKFLSKSRDISLDYVDDISHKNIELSERYFANNCILLSAGRAGIIWQKNPGTAYAQIPALSNSGLYTFNEYKKLLNKYANNNLIIIPNIFEILLYFIVYNGRYIIKKIFKSVIH